MQIMKTKNIFKKDTFDMSNVRVLNKEIEKKQEGPCALGRSPEND